MSRANRFREKAKEVRKKTNETLSNEIAILVSLNAADVRRMMPTKADKEEFLKLMAIVSARTKENDKVAKLTSNIGTAGSLVVRLLKTFVL